MTQNTQSLSIFFRPDSFFIIPGNHAKLSSQIISMLAYTTAGPSSNLVLEVEENVPKVKSKQDGNNWLNHKHTPFWVKMLSGERHASPLPSGAGRRAYCCQSASALLWDGAQTRLKPSYCSTA